MSTKKADDSIRAGITARIKEVVGENGAAFARQAKLTDAALRKYLKGTAMPGAEAIIRIARAAGVTTDWLLTGGEAVQVATAEKQFYQDRIKWFESQIDMKNAEVQDLKQRIHELEKGEAG